MFRVRSVNDVDEFVGVPGDPEDYTDTVEGLWASGESRPDWCFLIEDGHTTVGRIGFLVSPTVSDPSWLGSLPAEELFIYGLRLPWEGDYLTPGRQLIAEATRAVAAELPEVMEVRINNSIHDFAPERAHLMTDIGMELFQEKDGFFWADDGHLAEPGDRLAFRSIADIGVDAYRAVMAPCGEGTLDRNDRYYWTGCGPDNWAAQMTEYLAGEDTHMWLVGYRNDEPVGYVAVVGVEDWGSTIAHVGVVPRHRGHGYIHDLLATGTAAAQRSGITTMLSDVDILNQPMLTAMQHAGHVRDPERWHLWVFRSNRSALTVS